MVQRAIQVFPGHRKAQDLRQRVVALLSNDHTRRLQVGKEVQDQREVSVQEQAIRIQALVEKGDKLIEDGKFLDAYRVYDQVSIGIESSPYEFDCVDLPSEIESKKLMALSRRQMQKFRKSV